MLEHQILEDSSDSTSFVPYFRFYYRIVWNTVQFDEHGDTSFDLSVSHTQNAIHFYIKIKLDQYKFQTKIF